MRLPEGVRRYLIHLLERDAAERAQATAELDALAEAAKGHAARPLPDTLRGWLNDATGQMRWKRARPVAAKELADHLSDQYEAFLDEGMDEDAAAEATAREMGDAVETGTRLDRAWRPRPDWVMLGIVLLVAAVGKVAQYLLGLDPASQAPIRAETQVVIYLYGVACLLIGYFLDYTIFGRHCKLLYALWCVVGLLMLFGPLQRIQSGANFYLRQWVWFFPVLFAGVLYSQRGKGTAGIRNCLLYMLGMWFFTMFAPFTSALCVLTTVCCGLLFAAVWRGAFGKRTEVLLLLWGFRLPRRQTGLLARSVCMGVMLTFALQTALYVLQNFGFMLLSAYGLPLLSYGGNYLFQSMFLLGVLLSAQRTGRLESGLAPRVSCVSEVGK